MIQGGASTRRHVWKTEMPHPVICRRKSSERPAHSWRCCTFGKATGADTDSAWARLSLARRELEIAINEEDYANAARLRDSVTHLQDLLPAQKQILLSLLERLQLSNDVRERLMVIQALGDLGDSDALSQLQITLADPELGSAAEESMWSVFMRAPTPQMHLKMQRALELGEKAATWNEAVACLTEMIRISPDWAEAYNKRATFLYLMGKYHESIEDCKVVLQLNPFHFGAAAGMGMCCGRVSEYVAAIEAFEKAVRINPRLTHIHHQIMELKEIVGNE